MRQATFAAFVLLGLVPPIARGGEPFATFKAKDAIVEFTRSGSFSVYLRGKRLIAGANVVIASPGWERTGEQAESAPHPGYPKRGKGKAYFRFDIEEPSSGVLWRLEQRVRQERDSCRVRYELVPERDTHCHEAALFLEFPQEYWRGGSMDMHPGGRIALPDKMPQSRHFFSGIVRRLDLAPGDGPLAIRFSLPVLMTMQDAREFGREAYQAYPRIHYGGSAKAGRRSELEFTIGPAEREEDEVSEQDYAMRERLAIGGVRRPRRAARTFERYEIDLKVGGTYDSPFDPDQVRVDGHFRLPSGKEMTVPAFFWRKYLPRRAGGRDWLEASPDTGWKIRFAPVEPGEHSFFVTARDGSGEVKSGTFRFNAVSSGSRGFIRVSSRDSRYFEFDDGTPYYAVGENVATYSGSYRDYDVWLEKLGKAGANYGRIWMWSQCFGIEWGRPGRYRLESAWELDHALELAERWGIYIKLCFEAWRSFSGRQTFYRSTDIHPYWDRNGGPCATEIEVFTDPEARRMWRNRMRYIVARWGYSPSIMAWEFWNEINCVKGYHEEPHKIVNWSAEMASSLRQIDPWRHIVTNSLGSFTLNDELWKLPEMEFAQVHGYWHRTLEESRDAGKDMALMVRDWLGKIDGFGKPFLFAEFGLVNDNWGPSPLAPRDREGVHLHNGMWSSLMTGSCGTAMLWWWGNYVEPQNLYSRFASVAGFVEGVTWTTAGFRPHTLESSDHAARGWALCGRAEGRGLALAWVQNSRHTWWNVVERGDIRPIERVRIGIPGLPDGDYEVIVWDTWKGEAVETRRARAADGELAIELHDLARDLALRVTEKR